MEIDNILNSNFVTFNVKHIEDVIAENRTKLEKSLDQIENSIHQKVENANLINSCDK